MQQLNANFYPQSVSQKCWAYDFVDKICHLEALKSLLHLKQTYILLDELHNLLLLYV